MIFISTLALNYLKNSYSEHKYKQAVISITKEKQARVGINIDKKEIYSTKKTRKNTPKTR